MLQVGSIVDGKYRILSEIGHGGMSVVYMAINEKANKTWAIKEVRKDGKIDFHTARLGLMAEIETLKKLSHPYLPSIIDVIEDEDNFIIVMDYIEGQSFDKVIEENGALPEAYVVEWAKQLCNVLGYLHSMTPPIIYRDMKPANIMLKPDGNITLIDFGTAKNYEINFDETTGIGTIGYAAPEQYIGSGYGRTDARTDIYCLGMTLYHMLTNVSPSRNLISNKSIRAVNPSLSRGLDAIIQKCTQQQPDDRYQTCAELLHDLEKYRHPNPLVIKTFNFFKAINKKWWCLVGATVIVIVIAIWGFGFKNTHEKIVYPSERVMISDAAVVLKKEDISGYVTELVVKDITENEKYHTYTAECNISVKEGTKENKYTLILVYELNDDLWELNHLSKIK